MNLTVTMNRWSWKSTGTRGNVSMIVAFAIPLFAAVVGGSIDYGRATAAREALQDSLDAATLTVARSKATTNAQFQAIGAPMLEANLVLHDGAALTSSSFVADSTGHRIVSAAAIEVEATVLGVFTGEKIAVSASSEVARSARNMEVALVLDQTASMSGQRIVDLRAAANELIDVIVKGDQSIVTTKIAIIPYSKAVNVGTLATTVRGSVTAAKTITGATRANPVVITSSGHGYANGAKVYITGVSGMTQVNNKEFTVANRTTNTFQLQSTDGSGYSSYSSGGSAHCVVAGCTYYGFTNEEGNRRVFPISTCTTERTGTNAYKDTAPGTTLLGRHYNNVSANPCPTTTILPLTSDAVALKARVGALAAGGSTGGHIGVGWGWYLLAPSFASILPSASAPAAYNATNLTKAVVIMTDGEYNSAYCNGVISQDSITGSGAAADHINCNATNGSAWNQALAMCSAMKLKGVEVYTVGFDVVDDQRARDLMSQCATSAAHYHQPNTGAELKTAFRNIAQDISKLRISS